jgi:ComF family protein
MLLSDVFTADDVICKTCRRSLTPINRFVDIGSRKVFAYYVYDDVMSTIFHRFKEAKDRDLARMFIHPLSSRFDRRFKDKTVVCVPSSESKNEERGFLTLPTILEESKLPRIDVLMKTSSEKQSLRGAIQRKKVSDEIELIHSSLAEGKDVVLFDDIVTTGSTINACADLVEPVCRSLTCVCIAIHPSFIDPKEDKCQKTYHLLRTIVATFVRSFLLAIRFAFGIIIL